MKKRIRELLMQECKEMYDDNIKIAKEWEGTLLDGLESEDWIIKG